MTMDTVKIETLPANKPFLNTKLSESSDNLKDDNGIILVDDNDEDDEIHLRLSDDEDNEQDKTSGQVDNQEANLQIKRNEVNFAVKSEEILDSEQDFSNISSATVIKEINKFSNGDIDEVFSLNTHGSNMSGSDRLPTIHNSPKFWANQNNYDKRWQGGGNQSRGRQNYSTRNPNNWYNQQYPDNKFNNKQSYNNHNNHFKRRSSTRLSYNNSQNNWNKDAKLEDKDEVVLRKNSSLDDKTDNNHLIQESSDSDNVDSKENDSSVQNEKLDNDSNKMEEKELKNAKVENGVSSKQNCKENGNRMDVTEKSNSVEGENSESNEIKTLSQNKTCDESMTEKEEKCESKLDEVDKVENEGNSSSVNNLKVKDIKPLSKDGNSQKEDIDKKLELKIAHVASRKDDLKDIKKDSTNLVNDSEIIQSANSSENGDVENENCVENDDLTIESLKKESTMKNTPIRNDEIEKNEEDSNNSFKSNESTGETDVSPNESPNKSPALNNENMDIEDDTDRSDLVPDNPNKKESSEVSPMVIDDSSCSQQEEMNKEVSVEKIETKEKETSQEDIIEEVDLSVDDDSTANAITDKNITPAVPADNVNCEKVNEGELIIRKRRRRKRVDEALQNISCSDLENGVRQKRRSARNAEEMIRKEIMKASDEDYDSSDESEKLVTLNYRTLSLPTGASSPPSLKRALDEDNDSVILKKIKTSGKDEKISPMIVTNMKENKTEKNEIFEKMEPIDKEKIVKKEYYRSKENITATSQLVRKMSQEDIRGKLKKLTQEEMEALLVQKIVECITIRGEAGKLREQARSSQKNLETTRLKCQLLQKQVEGFEMVLNRISYDKRNNGDKYVPPIKINRSVGLQVNFVSDLNGIQNLKQINAIKAQTVVANMASKTMQSAQDQNQNQSPRKTLKTRSPRRPDVPTATTIQVSSSPVVNASTSLVVNKSVEQKRIITVPNSNIVQVGTSQAQAVVVPVSASTGSTRPAITIQRTNTSGSSGNGSKTSDLIDLTDEEDRSKSSAVTPITTSISTRFPRVLQAVPASVALSNTSNVRLLQATAQGSQTAIVNNVNSRVTYVMQSGVNGVSRQLVLTSPSNIRPVTTVSARNISTTYKQNVQLPNGAIRVLTTQAPAGLTIARHPAPLPETPQSLTSDPSWKLSPPAPSLKISKVATGIVLSWNMELSAKFAQIVSYQLYAYQEVTGTAPSPALWKKVGDVRALPLPMACTLTQFLEGNNYYFAVRAVDIHSRFGKYSKPGHISL